MNIKPEKDMEEMDGFDRLFLVALYTLSATLSVTTIVLTVNFILELVK